MSVTGMEAPGVPEYFAGRCVLLTGGTGFLGKAVLEKLLRSCPDLQKVFLLVRTKRGRGPESRLQHLFSSPLFSRVQTPGLRDKVVALSGDLTLPQLGLSPEDRSLLQLRVSVVLHCGATVRFTESLRSATLVNVAGTNSVLELAKTMANLEAFVHVSTAFCQCPVPVGVPVGETVLPVPIEPERLMQCAEWMSEDQMECIMPKYAISEGWPNAYTYTKAVTENLVQSCSGCLPVVIFRPSVVLGCWKEPVPGFIDSYNGAGGFFAGGLAGVVRNALVNSGGLADVVPLDLTVNGVVVAAWAKATRRRVCPGPTEIYNLTSSSRNPLTWAALKGTVERTLLREAPSKDALWYPVWTTSASRLHHLFLRTLLHLLPAIIVDAVYGLVGKEPRLYKTYTKIHRHMDAISYFMLRNWTFLDTNVQSLISCLSDSDLREFPCDVAAVSWPDMLRAYSFGIRQFLLKEDPSTIPEAKRRRTKLLVAHCVVVSLLGLLALRLLYSLALGLMSVHDHIASEYIAVK